MLQIVFYLIFAVVSQVITYKIVRGIDKRERRFLKKWELEYINAYKEEWKKSYFEKLAEEEKFKQIEEEKKKEQSEIKAKLKQVKVTEEDRAEYERCFDEAVKEVEKKMTE